MTDRMSDKAFEAEFGNDNDIGLAYPNASYGRLRQVAKRARKSEDHLKAQILTLFDYLVQNFTKEMYHDNANGACAVAVKIMESQRTCLELNDKLKELFEDETNILKMDRKKLIDLIRRMKSISLQ